MNLEQRFPVPSQWLSAEDRAIGASVGRWADDQVKQARLKHKDDPDAFYRRSRTVLSEELGLESFLWPEELGGLGQNQARSAFTLALVAEQIGRADVGLGLDYAVGQALAASLSIGQSKNLETAASMLLAGPGAAPVALVGPIFGTVGKSAPGYEGRRLQAVAQAKDAGWILKGKQICPLNAGSLAHVFAVMAHLDGDHAQSPGLFLIPSQNSALTIKKSGPRTGLWSSANARIDLNSATLDRSALVLQGVPDMRALMCWLRLLSAAVVQGALLAADEIIADWGENRVIKGRGQIFRDNPLTASVMARLAGRIATGRTMVFQLAHLLSQPEEYGPAGGQLTHLAALNTCHQVLGAATEGLGQTMELMGSAGYAREWNLERHWRDVRSLSSLMGSQVLGLLELAQGHYGSQAGSGEVNS